MSEVVDAVLEECRKSLPEVAWQWSAPVREAIERLVRLCRDERVGDEEFLRQVESTARALPELLPRLDTQALAEELEAAMLAATLLPTEVRGRAPHELVVIDAARRCGRSFIPEWKKCRLEAGSVLELVKLAEKGVSDDYVARGRRLSNVAYGMVKRVVRDFPRDGVFAARLSEVRHILKNHARELTREDWESVLLGPRRGDRLIPSTTESGAAAVLIYRPKSNGKWLLIAYTIESDGLYIRTAKNVSRIEKGKKAIGT